jgi:rhamnose utilization protein RhaD (predicted bifunctional aldolase and dehydrogenase)
MDKADIDDYISISTLIGSYKELVQGSGGNISVKNATHLCIKSSGRVLAETRTNYGYSICSIDTLNACFKNNSEDTKLSVTGGEPNSVPSMEVFFHLLPSKWVVHFHPTFLLPLLCTNKWKSIKSLYTNAYIPYFTPGLELSSYIHSIYKGEKILFLQNHGVILCADTIEQVYTMIDDIVRINCSHKQKFPSLSIKLAYTTMKYIKELTGQTMILKPCNHIKSIHDRFFFPITPDISLFLKQYPVAQEDSNDNLEGLLKKYYDMFHFLPTIVKTKERVFVLGNSYKHCICIEEVLESYLEILQNSNPSELVFFDKESIESLTTSEKEKHRMNIFNLTT